MCWQATPQCRTGSFLSLQKAFLCGMCKMCGDGMPAVRLHSGSDSCAARSQSSPPAAHETLRAFPANSVALVLACPKLRLLPCAPSRAQLAWFANPCQTLHQPPCRYLLPSAMCWS